MKQTMFMPGGSLSLESLTRVIQQSNELLSPGQTRVYNERTGDQARFFYLIRINQL